MAGRLPLKERMVVRSHPSEQCAGSLMDQNSRLRSD